MGVCGEETRRDARRVERTLLTPYHSHRNATQRHATHNNTMDEGALRAMLPMGFGKKSKVGGSVTSLPPPAPPAPQATTRPVQGPSRPDVRQEDDGDDSDDDGLTAEERAANRAAEQAEDDDDDSDADSDSSADLGPEPLQPSSSSSSSSSFPLTSQVNLTSHTKPTSAISLDPSGARIATGSYDYDVRLWDFGGMTSLFQPFKTISEPFGNYWIHDLAWSPQGNQLLVVSGTSQAKLYTREGDLITTYKKGDVYLRDMKQTNGHVAEITSCSWMDETRFITTSADSTIRFWDVENPLKQRMVINVKSKERGARTKVTAHEFSSKLLAAGCADGALHLWSTSGSYSSPNSSIQAAHEKGTDISSVVFSSNGNTLASRGTDHTLKLWDVRMFKKPFAERKDLQNNYSQTNIIFSPDSSTLLTGVSSTTTGSASIQILSPNDLHTIHTIPTSSSPIRLTWHQRINQLLATTSNGTSTIYYSSKESNRGALLCINKHSTARKRPDEEESTSQIILTPGAMDDSTTQRGKGTSQASKRRRMQKERQDPTRTLIPQRPMDGPGHGGRIGSAATKHVVQDIHRDHLGNKVDSREALLKYAELADKDPKYTVAWRKGG